MSRSIEPLWCLAQNLPTQCPRQAYDLDITYDDLLAADDVCLLSDSSTKHDNQKTELQGHENVRVSLCQVPVTRQRW